MRQHKESFWSTNTGFAIQAILLASATWYGMNWYTARQDQLQHIKELQKQIAANEIASREQDLRLAEVQKYNDEKQRLRDTEELHSGSGEMLAHLEKYGPYGKELRVVPKRSVQEEYELASQIMENTAAENRKQRDIANSGVTNNGIRVNQSQLNEWMLSMAEQYCVPLGKGSINYRHCRAGHKQELLNQCQQVPTSNLSAEKVAQCFAANNYRIVE